MTANFRDYIYPEHPMLSRLGHLDSHDYAQAVLAEPFVGVVMQGWAASFEAGEFSTGITTDGEQTKGLFTAGGDDGAPTEAAVAAANAFLDGLSEEDRRAIQHPIDSKAWRAWFNPEVLLFPFGLRLEEMADDDRERAFRLIAASTSERGYEKIVNLLRINEFLGQLTNARKVLNQGSYNINIYGTPSLTEPWGWNFWGHHVCLNTLFFGAQQVFTPVFFGAEPNVIDEGPWAGTAELQDVDRAGLDFIQSLTSEQLAMTVLWDDKRSDDIPEDRMFPGDELHLGGALQDNRVIPYEGINASELTPEQQELMLNIVDVFLAYQPDGPRAARVADTRAHLDETWINWIGGTGDDDVFYYRIQSPVIMIEFDHHGGLSLMNEYPQRFHTHTIVRTPNGGDYGVELIRQATTTEHRLTGGL